MGGGILLLLILTLTLFSSCKKNLISEDVVTIDATAKNKNQELIRALIEGRKFEVNDNSSNSISLSSPLPPSGGGYTVSLVDKMLKFNNADELNNFLVAADSAVSQWDPANDPELDGLLSEKDIAGEPALNNFDSAMGFNSLRKKYEMLYYDNANFRDTIKTLIENPDHQTVLNEANEVQIGDTIYRYLSTYFLAKIYNSDYNALHLLRSSNGKIIDNVNVEYYNPVSGVKYINPITSPQGVCMAFFGQPVVNTDPQDNRRKTASFVIYTYDGNNQLNFCLINGIINWGDGSSTTLNAVPSWIGLTYEHTYNVTPPPGTCQTFTISLSGTVLSSSTPSCNGFPVTSPTPTPINVCGAAVGCRGDNYWLPTDPPTYFTYGGYNYRLTGQVGVNNNRGLLNTRTVIFSRTYWAKQRGSNWYPTTNRKVRLGVEVFNNYYTNDCSTPNNFYNQYWHFNRSNITLLHNTNKNKIGWSPDFANAIRSNHYVRIVERGGNVVEFSYLNHYLH